MPDEAPKHPLPVITKRHGGGVAELPVGADDVVLDERKDVSDDVILAASRHQHQTNARGFAGVPIIVIVEFFLLQYETRKRNTE